MCKFVFFWLDLQWGFIFHWCWLWILYKRHIVWLTRRCRAIQSTVKSFIYILNIFNKSHVEGDDTINHIYIYIYNKKNNIQYLKSKLESNCPTIFAKAYVNILKRHLAKSSLQFNLIQFQMHFILTP